MAIIQCSMGTSKWNNAKKSACQCRRHKRYTFEAWVGKIPWRRERQPTPLFLPREFPGQRSLVGYSPWGCKELDATERTHQFLAKHIFLYIFACIFSSVQLCYMHRLMRSPHSQNLKQIYHKFLLYQQSSLSSRP